MNLSHPIYDKKCVSPPVWRVWHNLLLCAGRAHNPLAQCVIRDTKKVSLQEVLAGRIETSSGCQHKESHNCSE